MTIEEAIKCLDLCFYDYDDPVFVEAYGVLRNYVTNQNGNNFKLKVPECCDKCACFHLDLGQEPVYKCSMKSKDINEPISDPRLRPDWCPIVEMNKSLDEMEPEKRKQFESVAKGLSAIFGSEGFIFDQT